MRLTDIAQTWLTEILQEGDAAIDATLGNGFDALFLAQHIRESGHLFGFDVQEQAIFNSEKLLRNELCQQSLFQTGHEHMKASIPDAYHGNIKAIMFNLGWLPNSDKSIITKPQTTIAALEQSLEILAPQGRLSIMLYPGHQGGDSEAESVMQWLKDKTKAAKELTYHEVIIQDKPAAPMLIQVEKRL